MTWRWIIKFATVNVFRLLTLVLTCGLSSDALAGDEGEPANNCCAEHARGSVPGAAKMTGATPAESKAALAKLPPLPEGVTALRLTEVFKQPIGPRGLEYTEATRKLDGQRVRVLGFMVRQCDPKPGLFLLASRPVTLHEHEYGLCDDLPPATMHVFLPAAEAQKMAPHTPGLLLLTGTLRIEPRAEADGRISVLRLSLEAPSIAAVEAQKPTAAVTNPTAPTAAATNPSAIAIGPAIPPKPSSESAGPSN